jgi:hypothetical protein
MKSLYYNKIKHHTSNASTTVTPKEGSLGIPFEAEVGSTTGAAGANFSAPLLSQIEKYMALTGLNNIIHIFFILISLSIQISISASLKGICKCTFDRVIEFQKTGLHITFMFLW